MKLADLFRRKSVQQLVDAADDEESRKLSKTLTARDIFNAGVACIIGTGIFVITGVAAHDFAGPGIIMSFLLAGVVCAFVSFAYAEMASMIPVSGSAYTYAYATQGEFLAWIIGWDLLLEYPVGSAAVATGWSAYCQNLYKGISTSAHAAWGINLPQLPDYLTHAPSTVPWLALAAVVVLLSAGTIAVRKAWSNSQVAGAIGMGSIFVPGGLGLVLLGFGLYNAVGLVHSFNAIDLPAVLIVAALNFFLVKGVKHTAKMTSVFVIIKLLVIALFIVLGVWHINAANYTPFLPFGWGGVFTGASIVFFAYIGFDACTTMAEECKDPQKDVPRGVLASLGVCTVLYLAVAAIMTGAMSYTMLGGNESAAPMARVLDSIGYSWAAPLVSLGAIAGITSVLIVLLNSQSRIMMRMSRDGLIPPVFGKVSSKFGTPTWSLAIMGLATAVMSGLLPISELTVLTNVGTLAAFVMVCVGVVVLRRVEPDRLRKFKCPGYPYVPLAGAGMSLWLIYELPSVTLLRFALWMFAGVCVYFLYSRRNSVMNRSIDSKPDQGSDENSEDKR